MRVNPSPRNLDNGIYRAPGQTQGGTKHETGFGRVAHTLGFSEQRVAMSERAAPGIPARGGEIEGRIMVRKTAWMSGGTGSVPSLGFRRRALVGTSFRNLLRMKPWEKPQDFIPASSLREPPAASRVSDERPDENRRSALDPAASSQNSKCLLTKPTTL